MAKYICSQLLSQPLCHGLRVNNAVDGSLSGYTWGSPGHRPKWPRPASNPGPPDSTPHALPLASSYGSVLLYMGGNHSHPHGHTQAHIHGQGGCASMAVSPLELRKANGWDGGYTNVLLLLLLKQTRLKTRI